MLESNTKGKHKLFVENCNCRKLKIYANIRQMVFVIVFESKTYAKN